MEQEQCPDCKHSLKDNQHGFDQNDGYLDSAGHLVHNGVCTYCSVCNPQIFENEVNEDKND